MTGSPHGIWEVVDVLSHCWNGAWEACQWLMASGIWVIQAGSSWLMMVYDGEHGAAVMLTDGWWWLLLHTSLRLAGRPHDGWGQVAAALRCFTPTVVVTGSLFSNPTRINWVISLLYTHVILGYIRYDTWMHWLLHIPVSLRVTLIYIDWYLLPIYFAFGTASVIKMWSR